MRSGAQWQRPLSWPSQPQGQGRVALLQLWPITLKALKPKESDFEPQTLGDHIRKRRLELELTQNQAAERLGVNPSTVRNWESNRFELPIRSLPAVFEFLGYDPFPPPTTVPERLVHERRKHGWTTSEAARRVGVDRTTWQDWEGGKIILYRKHRTRLATFLGLDAEALLDQMQARWSRKHRRWENTESDSGRVEPVRCQELAPR